MKKILVSVAACVLSMSAFAGLDMYTGKNYTTLLTPTVLSSTASITNSTTTGVNIAGLPGMGALMFLTEPGTGPATGSVSFSLYQCATTNGTYTLVTNQSVSAYVVTNGVVTAQIDPNGLSQYIRVVATGTATTNGCAAAILITN
jgi:hypothetical protein